VLSSWQMADGVKADGEKNVRETNLNELRYKKAVVEYF